MASQSSILPDRRRSSGGVKTRFGSIKLAKVRSRERSAGPSTAAMDLPDRFKSDDDEDVDDGTGMAGQDGPMFAQQSMYGVLAATQGKANFRFQQESGSESEGEDEESKRKRSEDAVRPSAGGSGRSTPRQHERKKSSDSKKDKGEEKRRRRKLSETKLVRSFLKPVRERVDSNAPDPMSQSQFLPPRKEEAYEDLQPVPALARKDAPILDRKLQAMAKADMDSSRASLEGHKSKDGKTGDINMDRMPKTLPQVIANIFQFSEPEEVASEYPCWYLQNVLLQGYMYITQKHVCFYSYLQKRTNVTVKTGHLGKQGKHSYRFRQYWFVLKGDIFSYYKSSAEPYSPLGVVDLRYAITADVTGGAGKDYTEFTITTHERVYLYKADTGDSAHEWVKQLQKVIFRSHNDGDAVKISLPIKNVVDVEEASMVDFAETIKITVIADDETFATDEYFFSFFSLGKEALNMLIILTEGNEAKKTLADDSGMSPLTKARSSPTFDQSANVRSSPRPRQEPARSTLSPLSGRSSPSISSEGKRSSTDMTRPSLDDNKSTSDDRGGRSVSADSRGRYGVRGASKAPSSPRIDDSTESFVTSSEQPTDSSVDEDTMQANMTASTMLAEDGVFAGPTLRMPQPRRLVSGSTVEKLRRQSQHSSLESSAECAIVQSPSRQQPDQSLAHQPDIKRTESGGSGRTLEAERLQPSEAAATGRLARGISTPLQRAMTVAGMVRSSSVRMGSYLSSSPKTTLSNWSDAIAGGKRNYKDAEGLAPDDSIQDPEQEVDIAEHERRFQAHFGLPISEKLVSAFYAWLHKTIPVYGKIYMGTRRFCFRSLWYGVKTKVVIPYKDIINVQKQRGFRWGYPGMVLVIKGHEELFFDFPSVGLRDDAAVTVLRNLETVQDAATSMILTEEEQQEAEDAAAENASLQAARKGGSADHDLQLTPGLSERDAPPILFDDPSASLLEFKPEVSMKITCLTIGSRGDVQPYIALCKGLLAEGHKPRIATHKEFKPWVERHGIEFAEVGGDPAELMRMCVDKGLFTPSFVYEANSTFRPWLNSLLKSAWEACKGSDLLIESPSAMCGIHIAEALEIPYFRAFGMPWTRTRAYPHAFAIPNRKMGGGYNYMSYTFFDNMFWALISGQINRWRGKMLGIGPTSMDRLQQNKVPFMYNFSPSVVVPPLDFSDWVKVTGYWFLDEGEDWQPPEDLANFIDKAREDGLKLVYIGFGSVTVADSRLLEQQIIDAVLKADVRCILSKGWSDRFESEAQKALPPIEFPACIHQIRSAPHDWLFKRVDAVVHHGGAGTTGASLRAGVPTIIKPFFGDQFFFATRVEDLGVGIYLKKVTANQLGKALWIATHDSRMRGKATLIGEQIRAENGVRTAIDTIYRNMDYARSLIRKGGRQGSVTSQSGVEEETEENWTFVEKDNEAEAIAAFAQIEAAMMGQQPQPQPQGKSGNHGRQMSLGGMAMRGRH
ncbi:glycosyltransferase family 1 protein [Dothistroma septosporum NZE10]|uniref:sterol 3beta-glucosyltransferase n=1 Tax=Dothistroma septosporum (strain NZE10 / CBS 128990) TaxID=675120 RepID=N1PIJ1_DOTSN|nr:glycosyltransferase family 1 protein [Dothistroma septosporum NZE10]